MRILATRLGAFGDCILMSGIFKELKAQGHTTIAYVSERGAEVFANNPHIDELIVHKTDSIPLEDVIDYLKTLKDKYKADKHIDLTGSIEHGLAKHPNDPEYNYPKYVRRELCDKNYYKETYKRFGLDTPTPRPDIYYTSEELAKAQSYIRPSHFNILWCMSGSGQNKAYPWTQFIMGEVFNNYDNVHFITVGDKKCRGIEVADSKITNLSGEIPMRISMALTGLVDLVISPDTGVLHASGQYDTPKIGLLGSTTKTNITETFANDYSLEADCPCAPCFRLIYDHTWQCPVDPITGAAWCMSTGILPEQLAKRIVEIIPDEYRKH